MKIHFPPGNTDGETISAFKDQSETLLSVLMRHCDTIPDHQIFTWINEEGKETDKLTYKQLWYQSGLVADVLSENPGISKGDRVMICYPIGLEFLAGLFGCMRAGVIACSAYPPDPNKLSTDFPVFLRKAEDADAKFALTTARFRGMMITQQVFGFISNKLKWIATDDLNPARGRDTEQADYYMPSLDDIAFIQYSSGSTGFPKGVMISHRSLVSNCRELVMVCLGTNEVGKTKGTVFVAWTPQYHDLGLIGHFMSSIYGALSAITFSPLHFIQNPLLWHELVVKYRAVITQGPNFAFGLLCKRLLEKIVVDEDKKDKNKNWGNKTRVEKFMNWGGEQGNFKKKELYRCKWNSIRGACIGAEPVDPKVLEQMQSVLGISKSVIHIGYGMAETGLFIASGSGDVRDGLVACGGIDGNESTIRVVKDGHEVPHGTVGEIWVCCPSLTASGYFGQPKLSERTFKNKLEGYDGFWLATGDLGKAIDGQLYVSGRLKELIIINGKNFFPVDLERSLEAKFSDVLRPGCTTAFQSSDAGVGIVGEVRKGTKKQDIPSASDIRRELATTHGVSVAYICLLKDHSVPKTTSGKLRRTAVKERSLEKSWEEDNVLIQQCLNEDKAKAMTLFSGKEQGQASSSEGKQNPPTENQPSKAVTTTNVHEFFSRISMVSQGVAADHSWVENGLTSITALDLRVAIADSFGVPLPPNFFDIYTTPAQLEQHILNSTSAPIPVKLPTLEPCEGQSWFVTGLLQACGILILLVLFAFTIILACNVGSVTATQDTVSAFSIGNRQFSWHWLPLAFPTWMASFSIIVILTKWILIGRYRECEMRVPSMDFVQWWFVDRVVLLWEQWVGTFLLGTPIICYFYRLMGANIHPSTRIEKFVREFDLVHIEKDCWLKQTSSIKCRMFGTGNLRFRKVHIEKDCIVGGMLCPGVHVGQGSTVETRAVLPEGAQAPSNSSLRGNPAIAVRKEYEEPPRACSRKVLGWTCFWAVFTLYMMLGLNLLAQFVVLDGFPKIWRFAPLLTRILVVFFTGVLIFPVNITMKWILIGKRIPGPYEETPWQVAADWVLDLHFLIAYRIVSVVGLRWWYMWNTLLRLYGLDVDIFLSTLNSMEGLVPSKVDLIRLRSSYTPTPPTHFEVTRNGEYHQTVVENSILGALVVIGPGASLINASVPACEYVNEVMTGRKDYNLRFTVTEKIEWCIWQMVWMAAVMCSFAPFELVSWALANNLSESVVVLSAALVTQLVMSCVILFGLEMVAFPGKKLEGSNPPVEMPKSTPLLSMMSYMIGTIQQFSLFPLLHGTPLFNVFARMLRAKVGKNVLFMNGNLQGCFYHVFEDNAVVDGAIISEHAYAGGVVIMGEVRISGIIHEGCFVFQGFRNKSPEFGPYRCGTKTYESW